MALFKINKGKSENLPEDKHDGWAYFTTDDGKFYIDYTDGQDTLLRKALNAANADYATNATNATYATRDEDGQRIVVRYVKQEHGSKQTVSITSGGTALRLNSSHSRGSLVEFSQYQTVSNEDGSTSQKPVSLGYLGMWDGMPCYRTADGTNKRLLTWDNFNINGSTPTGELVYIYAPRSAATIDGSIVRWSEQDGKAYWSPSLPPSHGGTGITDATTPKDVINSFINKLDIGSSVPLGADYFISQSVGGGTTNTIYNRRPISTLATYINNTLKPITVNLTGATEVL